MSWAEFPYRGNGDGTFRTTPVITVSICHDGKCQYFDALIDSGCEVTLADADIADFFGIDLSKFMETETAGISGSTEGRRTEVIMQVCGVGDMFESPVVFVKNLPYSILLGQNNFFENFNVKFEKSKNKIFIEAV